MLGVHVAADAFISTSAHFGVEVDYLTVCLLVVFYIQGHTTFVAAFCCWSEPGVSEVRRTRHHAEGPRRGGRVPCVAKCNRTAVKTPSSVVLSCLVLSCPLNLTVGMGLPPLALVAWCCSYRHAAKLDPQPSQLTSPGRYRVVYLNTNARALPATEASKLFETIAKNLKEACRITVRLF